MNLLVKKLSINKLLKPGLILLIPVFLSCETSQDLGIKYELDSNANVKFTELTLPATNIYIDSLLTEGEGSILVGTYTDDLVGSIEAEGYFQFFYDNGPLPRSKEFFREVISGGDTTQELVIPEDTLRYDSIAILFESSNVIPLEDNVTQGFEVYTLTDTLNRSLNYIASNKQETNALIGSYSGSIVTDKNSYFRIRLDDSFGGTLFTELSDIAVDSDRSILNSIFQSLAIVPTAESNSISLIPTFSDTTRLIVYSSPIDPDRDTIVHSTFFEFTGKNYSYLERDRSGSSFSGIQEKDNFDLDDETTLIDPLAGITTSFSLLELEDFFRSNDNILINNATLALEFESESSRDTLVTLMNFFRKTDKGIFGPAIEVDPFANVVLSDDSYTGRAAPQPAFSRLNSKKDNLLLNATIFYQELYRQFKLVDSLSFVVPTTSNSKLVEELVMISPLDVTLNRTIFKPNGVKLRLYYTEVNQ